MLTKTFRGMLFRCGSESWKHFPSPEELKKKILISTKPPKEYLESKTVQTTRTPMVKETSWSRVASVRISDLTPPSGNDFANIHKFNLL